MKVTQVRHATDKPYTISTIYVDGKRFCHALESEDRGLHSDMDEENIWDVAFDLRCAVPYGTYEVDITTFSTALGGKAIYFPIRGKLPVLKDVKGFGTIHVMIGHTERDTRGNIAVGRWTDGGRITDSQSTFYKLYTRMQTARLNDERIIWEIRK